MDWAMRSARSGSVAASASAMLASALAFEESSVMDWAMRSASAMSRAARSGSVAAGAPAVSASALAFKGSSAMDWAVRSASVNRALPSAGTSGGSVKAPTFAADEDWRPVVVPDSAASTRCRRLRSRSASYSYRP